MAGLLLKQLLNLFQILAWNLNCIKIDTGDIILLYYLNKQELANSDILNKLIIIHNCSLGNFTQDNNILSIIDLLFNFEEVQG